ncbi:hypothetical protein H0H93_012285 [Arthromyces matolae]|nr:hypothetical protein H0H93_012285 [Arthromyces matolae]
MYASLFLFFRFQSIKPVDKTVEATMAAPAHKELVYLKRFGRPLPPFRRERRESYGYKEQLPSDHINNLERYHLIASSLIPKNPALHDFRIRHPDLQPGNIMVSKSPGSNEWQIVSLLDWQHASILPLCLTAGVPRFLQNYHNSISQFLAPPSQATNRDESNEYEQDQAKQLYHRRLAHLHYIKNTKEYNKLHYDAFTDLSIAYLRRLFEVAGFPWEGETQSLKVALIEMTDLWPKIAREGVPCPIVFDPEDLRDTKELGERLQQADENFQGCQAIIGFASETWVSNEHYEMAVALAKQLTEAVSAMQLEEYGPAEGPAEIEANWFLNDMDEKDYM